LYEILEKMVSFLFPKDTWSERPYCDFFTQLWEKAREDAAIKEILIHILRLEAQRFTNQYFNTIIEDTRRHISNTRAYKIEKELLLYKNKRSMQENMLAHARKNDQSKPVKCDKVVVCHQY